MRPVTRAPQRIVRAHIADVAEEYGIDADAISGVKRRGRVSRARWEVWRRLNAEGFRYVAIGNAWGCHHTSVLYGLRQVGALT